MSTDDKEGIPYERRRAPRVETSIEGKLHGRESGTCRVINISRAGALAVVSQPLPEMAQVRIKLQFETPGGDMIGLDSEAAVVRCTRRSDGDYDIGLYFTVLSAEDRAALKTIIETQALHPTA